jgi:hypothetical protein
MSNWKCWSWWSQISMLDFCQFKCNFRPGKLQKWAMSGLKGSHEATHTHTHTLLLINLFSREYSNWCWILHSFVCTLHPELQSKHILCRTSCLSNSLYILPHNFCYICYREHTCSYGTNLILVLVFISFLQNTAYKNVIYIIKWFAKCNSARWTFITWNPLESLKICLRHFLFIGLKEVQSNPATAPPFLHHNSHNK